MSTTTNTRTTTVRLPAALLRAVEAAARRDDRTVSAIVRLALADWLANQRQQTNARLTVGADRQ
jgi:predicted transcriptional regulator